MKEAESKVTEISQENQRLKEAIQSSEILTYQFRLTLYQSQEELFQNHKELHILVAENKLLSQNLYQSQEELRKHQKELHKLAEEDEKLKGMARRRTL